MRDFRHEAVGMLVAEQPLRAAVFDRFGIDYCCGGKQTLIEACAKGSINPETILAIIQENDALTEVNGEAENWLHASITALIDHIQQTHHAYLKLELPRLQSLADKVALVHGVKEPRLGQVASVFSAMRQEIEQHTMKEDTILFPFMRKLDGRKGLPGAPFGNVANPVHCMESEHNDAGEALLRLRDLTDQYTAPDHACTSWRALVAGLAHLDQDLRTHIHKENSILFPKAIEAESKMRSMSQV